MRIRLAFGCAAALVMVAACNADGASEANGSAETRNEATEPADADGVDGAAPVDIARVMHDRHEHYHDIGDAMKAISRQLKGGSPEIPTVERHAALIAELAPQVSSWFPAGSGPESGRRTRARAEIWAEPEAFRERADDFARAATRFHAAAEAGDLAAIRAAHSDLGDSCKSCHDRFRGPDDGH